MFLEPWMIIVLAMMFGLCAFLNYQIGFKMGIELCLSILHEKKYIDLAELSRDLKRGDLKC